MDVMIACGFALLAVGCVAASSFASDKPQPGTQQPARLERQTRIDMAYLIALPRDYEAKPSWPLLLFLHGAGERGGDLELLKKHGPPSLIEQGRDLPFIVVSPQCPKDLWWEPVGLMALLDEVQEKHRVDPDRVYVTGLSMGGFGAWSLAAYAAEQIAAIAPICGGGEPVWAGRLTRVPVWAFHGAADTVVPKQRSQEMADAIKRRGGDVKLTIYPGVGHDSWSQTYHNPELYDWLLQHRRGAEK
jgi:predicted peptidase